MVTTITLAKTNCSRQGLCRSVTLTCGPVQAEWFGGAIWFALWGPFLEISMIAQITPLLVIPMQGLFGNCLEEALSWVYGAFPPCFLESVHSAAASTPHMCRDMRIIFRRPSCYAKGSEGPQQNQGGLCILCWCRPICAPIMREHMLCSMQNEHMRLAEEDMKQEPNNNSSRYMKSTPMALKPRGGVYVLVCGCASPRTKGGGRHMQLDCNYASEAQIEGDWCFLSSPASYVGSQSFIWVEERLDKTNLLSWWQKITSLSQAGKSHGRKVHSWTWE